MGPFPHACRHNYEVACLGMMYFHNGLRSACLRELMQWQCFSFRKRSSGSGKLDHIRFVYSRPTIFTYIENTLINRVCEETVWEPRSNAVPLKKHCAVVALLIVKVYGQLYSAMI